MKEFLFRQQERAENPDAGLDDIARALGGAVSGRAIVAPAPGGGSMTVFFNTIQPEQFYVYDSDAPLAKAKAYIREKLSVIEPAAAPAEGRIEAALAIWRQAVPAAGTIVETYLRSRAIALPVPDVIRFHGALWHGPSRGKWPAMVALVTDVNDVARAVHRTFLAPSGNRKAPVDPPRMTLGPIKGGAIRLAPAAEHIAVGEGIETCLSVMMTGRTAWSALSAIGIRTLILPSDIREISILVDQDDRGEGERASQAAAMRWLREGRRIALCRPPAGMDFNDLLMRKES